MSSLRILSELLTSIDPHTGQDVLKDVLVYLCLDVLLDVLSHYNLDVQLDVLHSFLYKPLTLNQQVWYNKDSCQFS